MRQKGRVGSDDDDDGAAPGPARRQSEDLRLGNLAATNGQADGDAHDREAIASTVIGLHEHADGVATCLSWEMPRRSTRASLEAVADHPGPAADVAFTDRTVTGGRDGVPHVGGAQVMTVDVVQDTVPGLGDDGQPPERVTRGARCRLERDDPVTHHPHRVRGGDGYR